MEALAVTWTRQPMKSVIAFVKPFKLDEILDALTRLEIQGLTVTEVKGYGRQKARREFYRGAEYTPKHVPMLKLEVAVSSDQVEKVTEAIIRVDVDNAAHIRTGETDEIAGRTAG